jgi:hypothetical protein
MAFEPENPLEKALQSAITEPMARPEFYRLLLASELFIIGQIAGETPGEPQADAHDRLMIATVEYKGKPYHPVFSAVSRLKEFVDDDAQFMGMAGRQLFMAAKGAQFLLNPGSECGKELTADEIASALARSNDRARAAIGPPAVYPHGLVDSLSALFATRPEVKAAHLVQIAFEGQNEPPHPLIGVDHDGDWQALSQVIGEVLKEAQTDTVIDMIAIDRAQPTDVMQALLKTPPFFARA